MRLLLILVLSSVFLNSHSQRFSGNYIGNYSGVYGIQENPATFVNKKPKWDINIIGTGIHFYNEYGYFANESVLSLSGKTGSKNGTVTIPADYNAETDALYYIRSYPDPIFGFIFNQVTNLPSFALNFDKSSIGFFTNLRVQGDGLTAPTFFNYKNLDRLIDFQNYKVATTNLNTMVWGEIGANYAYQHQLYNDHVISIGANVKYLLGYEAFYVQNKKDYEFYRVRDTFVSTEANVTVGFATGVSKTGGAYKFGVNGTGLGADLGVEYMIPYDEEDAPSNYKIKFGAAIKDIGSISFSNNAEEHNFVSRKLDSTFEFVLRNKANNYQPLQRVSYWLYGDSSKSQVAKEIKMYLPTALNAHMDMHVRDNFFVNAYFSRRIGSNMKQIAAPNVWMVGGRYEKRWFESGISMSLTEDQWFGVGTYVRVGPLTIGSDHINTVLFSQSQLKGSDIYMNLRILIFAEKDKINSGFLGLGSLFKKSDKAGRSNRDDSGHWRDKNWNKDKSGDNANTGNSTKGKKAKCATYK